MASHPPTRGHSPLVCFDTHAPPQPSNTLLSPSLIVAGNVVGGKALVGKLLLRVVVDLTSLSAV
jgi:hypothetical protein